MGDSIVTEPTAEVYVQDGKVVLILNECPLVMSGDIALPGLAFDPGQAKILAKLLNEKAKEALGK